MSILMPGSNDSAEVEAKIAEMKAAPVLVRRTAGFGTLLGFILLLRFCASAFVGHVSWGRAIASGILQFALFWFASFSVHARSVWSWWVLLVLTLLHAWPTIGHTLRLARVTVEGSLAAHGRAIIFDVVGLAQLCVSAVVLLLLLSKQVRTYVFSKNLQPNSL